MPIRDSGGGNIEFGVKITAENEVFIDGVKASREEVEKLGDGLRKLSGASEEHTRSQEKMTASVIKGTGAVEILKRAWDGALGLFHEVQDATLAMQQSNARLEAVLKATGGAAGQSAESVNALADGLARITKFDDTGIKNAATTLLTFTEISGDAFTRILKLSADLAATGRGDLDSWVQILAKAGTEPAAAIGLVERQLGKLRPALKVAIQDAVDFNDKQRATQLLLDEVSSRVGGTAVESYRGLERQLDGTSKAWTRLKETVGTEIFSAHTREASVFEKALDHMAENFKTRVSDMKQVWNSIPPGLLQLLAGGPVGFVAGKVGSAIAKSPDETLDGLRRARDAARQYDGDTKELDRQIALAEAAARRAKPQGGGAVDPWQSEPGFQAPISTEMLTTRQKQQLRDQDLQNLQAYLGVVYQSRAEEANREVALEEWKRKMGISSEEEYARTVGGIREGMARDEVARIQSELALARQRAALAGSELSRAKGSEKPDEIFSAEQRVRETREKVLELTEQERAAQAKVADAVADTGRELGIVGQKLEAALTLTSRDSEDFLRKLQLQTSEMAVQQQLLGASPNAIQKANIARQLTNNLLEKELAIRRQIEDLQRRGADPREIKAKEEEIAKLRAGTKQAIEEQQRIVDQNMQSTVAYYANAAGLAKGFFEQNTEGYKILEKTEKAFRLLEQAMALEAFLVKQGFLTSWLATDTTVKATATGTDKAFTGQSIIQSGLRATADGIAAFAKTLASVPFPANIAAGALVVGLLAAAGVAIATEGRGGAAPSSADRQRDQGTGTVLGDATKKSDSIARALDIIRANSDEEMPLVSDMAASLRSIDAQMAGVSSLIARSMGVALGRDTSGLGLGTTNVLDARRYVQSGGLFYDPFGGVQYATNQLFGTRTRSLADSGIAINDQTVGAARQGFSGSAYADVTTTTRRLFGLVNNSSTSRQTSALPNDVAYTFTQIIDSIVGSITSAVEILGGDGKAVEQLLNSLKIDSQSISLKDLKGDEIQKALEAIFGKLGDDMATTAMPMITQFQHVGEGAFETLIRVAQGVQTAKGALDLFGVKMVDWQNIANKSGDVAVEIIRQSLVATETIDGVLTGVGQMLEAFDGTSEDLIAIYRKLLDIRVLVRATGGDSNSLSAAMIAAAGGVSQLTRGLEAYNENFFTDGERVAAQQRELAASFARLGVAMPSSNAGFRALVDSIDTSTEAGQRFYGAVIALAPAFAEASNGVQNMVNSMYQAAASMNAGFGRSYAEANLRQAAQNWLASSPGARGNGFNVDDVIREIGGLVSGGTSSNPRGFTDALAYVQTLGPAAVDAFNQLLNAYRGWQSSQEQGSSAPIQTFTGSVNEAANALEELARRTADAKEDIANWLQQFFLDDKLSPLTPEARLNYSHDQYVENMLKAQGGDVDALAQWSKFAQSYVSELRSFYGSGSEYLAGAAGVTSQGASLAGLSSARPPTAGDLNAGFQSVVEAIQELQAAVGQGNGVISGVITRTSRASQDALVQAVRDGPRYF